MIFIFGGCGALEKINFEPFFLWLDMVVIKGLILDSFILENC